MPATAHLSRLLMLLPPIWTFTGHVLRLAACVLSAAAGKSAPLCHASCATILIWLCIFLVKHFLLASLITHHLICPQAQVSPTAFKLPEIAELSGLRPEPRWGAKSAPQTPSSGAAAGVARCAAFGVTFGVNKKNFRVFFFLDLHP